MSARGSGSGSGSGSDDRTGRSTGAPAKASAQAHLPPPLPVDEDYTEIDPADLLETDEVTATQTQAWFGGETEPRPRRRRESTGHDAPAFDASELFAEPGDGDATVVTAMPYELRPPYTGRKTALATLLETFEDSRESSALSFVVLTGEPGMGKSRTIKELARSLQKSDPDVRFLIGFGDDPSAPFAAFGRLLGGRFGIAPGDPPEACRAKIGRGVAEVLPQGRVTEITHLLAHLLRVPFTGSAVVQSIASPQQLEARTFLALRRFLAADASAGPLVLCFENLELCGPETINLLHYLAAGLASSPVMILGTAREEIFARYPSFGDSDVPLRKIELGALSGEEVEALVAALCRPLDTVPARLVAHAKKLGGSPRAIFELVRLLLESEAIIRTGPATWQVDGPRLAAMPLPTSYDEVVRARLAVMDPVERDLISKAAVIGETFWLDAVVALDRVTALADGDPDGPTLADIAASGDHSRTAAAHALKGLVEREWLVSVPQSSVPGETEFRFAYPNLWQLVYGNVEDVRRQLLHRTCAQWLELRPEGRGPTAQEEVGRHLELGGDPRGAAQRYRRAAEAARDSYLNDRAIGLYRRALGCIGESDTAARIHLWHDLGSVSELKGELEAALGAFERMLRLSWVVASRAKAAVAFNKMGRVWRRKGALELALEYLERGLELFQQVGDDRGISGSLDDIGKVLYLLGRYDEAFEKVTEALQLRGRHGDPRSIAASLSNLGNIQKDRGNYREAHNCHEGALELRKSAGDRPGVIASLSNLAVLAFEHDDFEEARRGWEQALSEAEIIGALPLQALGLANLGELALREHRFEEGRSRLEEALELAEEIDDRQLVIEATRNLALIENQLGRIERARELASAAHQRAAEAGLRECEGRALLTLGEVHSASLYDASLDDGTQTPAAQFYERGIALLREIGNDGELAKGLELLGRYYIEQGRISQGKDLLREALMLFTKLGTPRADEVERLIAAV